MQRVYNGMPDVGLHEADWHAGRPGDGRDGRIELAILPGGQIAMRNSRDSGGPVLIYTNAEIEAFIAGAKDGDFDDLIS
ncbi:MAG TPA: DUF397 domain-containing protein [Streptosporangiaceae bacterium]